MSFGVDYGILKTNGSLQCITLSPVVALQADAQSQEYKEALALAVYHLRRESTGSVEGDIRLLSTMIQE